MAEAAKAKMESLPIPDGEDKHRFLRRNQESLYYDTTQRGVRCNLIFYTGNRVAWIVGIKDRYSLNIECKQLVNGYQLKTKDHGTINVYSTGIITVQGTAEQLTEFERDFENLKERVGELAPEQLTEFERDFENLEERVGELAPEQLTEFERDLENLEERVGELDIKKEKEE